MIFGAAFYFIDKNIKTVLRVMTALVHCLGHLLILFFGSWGISVWVSGGNGLDFASPAQMFLTGFLIFLLGYAAGSFLMGIYLLLTMNLFGWNANEAFASLAHPDYKNFLRMKISPNGDLTVYPVGIKSVARNWKPATKSSGGQLFEPDDTNATLLELIEEPIVIKKVNLVQTREAVKTDAELPFEKTYQVQVLQEVAEEIKVNEEKKVKDFSEKHSS